MFLLTLVKSAFQNHRDQEKDKQGHDMDICNASHAITPIPLEVFVPPSLLNGETGSNRAPIAVTKQIDANNDLQAIQTWLLEFTHSPQTLRTYRKEAERLLLWSIIEKHKTVFKLITRRSARLSIISCRPTTTTKLVWIAKTA